MSDSTTRQENHRTKRREIDEVAAVRIEPTSNEINASIRSTTRLTVLLQYICGLNELMKNQVAYNVWIGYISFFNIRTPEAIEEVMTNTKFNEKAWFYRWIHCWLGTGLLTSHGDKWRSRRKLLTPAFHFDILKDFLPTINEKSMYLVKKLRHSINKDFTNITPLVTLCSLDIICETTLGLNIKAQENSESEYVKAVARVSEVMTARLMNVWSWFDFTFFLTKGKLIKSDLKLLHEFTLSVIREKKKEILNRGDETVTKSKRKPLIEVLLEHHIQTKDLTEEDIREEVDTFTFEGHDTTAMAITWSLYLIGLYKETQDKLYEELYEIFGEDTQKEVTNDDLKYLRYLDCVIKECLRLYPSVAFFGRNACEDTTINGLPVLKGQPLVISPYTLHRSEEIYPNAEVFDPNRFTPENSAKRHPFAYIPFAAGSRNCIGQRFAMMEIKTVLANVLRNYVLESLDHRDILVPCLEIILRPSKPVRVKVRPRQINSKIYLAENCDIE